MTNEGTKGKHINAQTKVVDGLLCMLLAKSGSRAIRTELYWDIRGKAEDPFILVMTLPGLDSEDTPLSMPMDATQGSAAYANHPRKVHPSNVPEDCPVHSILDALDEAGNVPRPEGKGKPGRKPKSEAKS